jgi:hypothetical protein
MRKRTIQRLEALENKERLRKQQELRSLQEAASFCRMIVFAYYLGGLRLDGEDNPFDAYPGARKYSGDYEDEDNPFDAYARALNYAWYLEFYDAIEQNTLELCERHLDAWRRLFAIAELQFDTAAPEVLFDAFVMLVDQLPGHWLSWLKSNLRRSCPDARIAPGCNLPEGLSACNFCEFLRAADAFA